MARRVLLAGLFHESHAFLEGATPLSEFSVLRGEDLFRARGDGSPLAGALEVTDRHGWNVLAAADYRATPSALADDLVFEQFWNEFAACARREWPRGVDGILLVLHGAMSTVSYADIEGELLERIRALPGAGKIPLAAVLDLHANVTAKLARHAHSISVYRENPHTDAFAAAVRAAESLERLMASGKRSATYLEQPPIIWPPGGTATAAEPMRTLENLARRLEMEHPDFLEVCVFAGFAYADLPETGVSFSISSTGTEAEAREALGQLMQCAWDLREKGNALDLPPAETMRRLRECREGPIVLVEPSDNIGGGAPGDGTGMLRLFIAERIRDCAVVLNDPHAVAALQALRLGERITLPLGGKGSLLDAGPLTLDVELLSRSNGRFELEDRQSHLASMGGTSIDMGPCAVVRHEGARILLTSRKTPPFDLGQLRSQGIEPEKLFAMGVKAAVAHRRAYDPIAKAMFWVETPGACPSDVRVLPYRNVRRPVYPLDREVGG